MNELNQYNSGNVEYIPYQEAGETPSYDSSIDPPQNVTPVPVDNNNPVPKTLPNSNPAFKETIYGYVKDDKGVAIAGATVQLYWLNGEGDKGEITIVGADGSYSGWTDYPDQVGIIFSAKGHQTLHVPWTQLQINPDIILKQSFPVWMILLVVAAVAVYRKRTGKVGKIEPKDVEVVAMIIGGIIGVVMINKILVYLGIFKDQHDKNLDNAAADPNSFWNPNYWQTIKPANKSYTYALTQDQALQMCDGIKNAMGIFNDDEAAVYAIFHQCRTKANCSFLAWVFQNSTGDDLLEYLRGDSSGWPEDHLSNDEVDQINQYISNLPNY